MSAEIGQIIHNNPVGLACPSYAHALVAELRREIARVYWNVQQQQWPGDSHFDWWSLSKEDRAKYPADWFDAYDPKISGIVWHEYYNWGGSPDDSDWDQAKADAPNFSFEGVEIRWYKHFGRSMNVNVAWTPEQWVRWYDRCEQHLSAFEAHSDKCDGLYLGHKPNYPDPAGRVDLKPSEAALYHLKLLEQIQLVEAQLNVIACEAMTGLDRLEGKAPPDYRDSITPDDYRWCHTVQLVQELTGSIPRQKDDE